MAAHLELYERLQPWLLPGFGLESRAHALNTYIKPVHGRPVHIKRDDELSSGITGSKYRKFASLLRHFELHRPDEVLIIGSAQSNNVAAALQLFNESGIRSRLMLLRSNEPPEKGNLLWIKLLHPYENILWVDRADWPQVNALAAAHAAEEREKGKEVFILYEGSSVAEAIPGSMTLAADIFRNEQENGLHFRHIFMDSGTGTAAIGLLLGLTAMQRSDVDVHITLIAGDEAYFMERYAYFAGLMHDITGTAELYDSKKLHFHKPLLSPSFGSLNGQVLEEVKNIARQEGILMDPVYSVKHLYTAGQIIEQQKPEGDSLLVYGGGSLGLAGYQDKLT